MIRHPRDQGNVSRPPTPPRAAALTKAQRLLESLELLQTKPRTTAEREAGGREVAVRAGSDDRGFPREILPWVQSWGPRVEVLAERGEEDAAALLRKWGGKAEYARDLAYRLYALCERKRWAQDALAHNALVTSWPELTRLASQVPAEPRQTHERMF